MDQTAMNQAGKLRWLVVVALGLLAAGLLVELGRATAQDHVAPPDVAADQPAPAAPPSVFAVAGQVTRDGYGIYLVDMGNQTLCVYQYVPSMKKLHLLAARTYAFDTQLDDYNTEPSPREIRNMVTNHPRLTDVDPLPDEPIEEPTTQPDGPAED